MASSDRCCVKCISVTCDAVWRVRVWLVTALERVRTFSRIISCSPAQHSTSTSLPPLSWSLTWDLYHDTAESCNPSCPASAVHISNTIVSSPRPVLFRVERCKLFYLYCTAGPGQARQGCEERWESDGWVPTSCRYEHHEQAESLVSWGGYEHMSSVDRGRGWRLGQLRLKLAVSLG